MRKFKVANIKFYSALPYRALSGAPYIDYSEGTPVETARLLNERVVDLAHIPTTEFATHGGYVGLDFGLATRCKVEGVVLFCTRPVKELKTIYVDDRSISSVCLLRVLLADKWGITPDLVRFPPRPAFDLFGGDVGALIVGDDAFNRLREFPFSIDLTVAWKELTGLPFVYSFWAFRPESLTVDQCKHFTEICHKSVQARETLAIESAHELLVPVQDSTTHITETFAYRLDDECIAGIDEFFIRSARLGLSPEARYQRASYSLSENKAVAPARARTPSDILKDAVNGERISVSDGVRLATDAHIADLALVADIIRHKETPQRRITYKLSVRIEDLKAQDSPLLALKEKKCGDVERLVINESRPKLQSVEHYEQLFREVKRLFPVKIEALSVPRILKLAKNTGQRLEEVISRLIFAGLDSVPADGGEILVGRSNADCSASDWLMVINMLHRFGAQASCAMRVSVDDTWEERMLHLAKLRSLQDENQGFREFHLVPSTRSPRTQLSETIIRATVISRLFMDNLAVISEPAVKESTVCGVLGLSFGANQVEVDIAEGGLEVASLIEVLRTLHSLGMDFEKPGLMLPEELLVH